MMTIRRAAFVLSLQGDTLYNHALSEDFSIESICCFGGKLLVVQKGRAVDADGITPRRVIAFQGL